MLEVVVVIPQHEGETAHAAVNAPDRPGAHRQSRPRQPVILTGPARGGSHDRGGTRPSEPRASRFVRRSARAPVHQQEMLAGEHDLAALVRDFDQFHHDALRRPPGVVALSLSVTRHVIVSPMKTGLMNRSRS